MATVELESPETGWVGSIGFTEAGRFEVLDARDPEWHAALVLLLSDLITQPTPSGRVLSASLSPDDPDLLYDLADMLLRRKPECRGERVRGYVAGGSRWVDLPDEPDEGE